MLPDSGKLILPKTIYRTFDIQITESLFMTIKVFNSNRDLSMVLVLQIKIRAAKVGFLGCCFFFKLLHRHACNHAPSSSCSAIVIMLHRHHYDGRAG